MRQVRIFLGIKRFPFPIRFTLFDLRDLILDCKVVHTNPISQYRHAERPAVTGRVMNQAVRISPATLQRTLLQRSAEPTPMIAELTTWVVLTGPPTKEAAMITNPELNCEAKPWTGRTL